MNKKRIISYVMLLMVCITLSGILSGCDSTSEKIPIQNVEKDVYIYDADNVIDNDVEEKLNKMLVELEEKTEAEFAVVSVESLLDKSIEDCANNLFNTFGIGKKGKNNGILLLFSKSDEKVRLKIGRGLEGCLNDSKCGSILDKYFVPYREKNDYTKATEMTVKAVLNVVTKEYEIDIQGLEKNLSIKNDSDDELTLGEILGGLILMIPTMLGVIIIIAIFCSDDDSSSREFHGRSSSDGFGGGFSEGGGTLF